MDGIAEQPDALAAARARLDRLFASFNRLTPDELARIGYRPPPDEEHDRLMDAVDAAAEQTGRVALVDEVRGLARGAVMGRYSAGTLHPTWAGLNWGISQGTVDDRVAIAEALADAAAAAAVEDALDPDVAAALAFDAEDVLGLASGAAFEGSLGHALDNPEGADLGPSLSLRWLRLAVAALAVFGLGGFVLGVGPQEDVAVVLGPEVSLAVGLVAVAAFIVLNAGARRRAAR
jgi:hypothetical protein